jgi:predicted nucleotidyltransferase
MDSLERLLSSRVKARLLRLLFGPGLRELHIRDLARRADLNEATVRQELKRLTGLRLVEPRVSGNRTYHRANAAHPLAPEIRNLVLKTSGLAEALAGALRDGRIRAAFIFGSMADGSEKPESDIDLMIVGSLSLRDVSTLLADVAPALGREINPHVFTPKEFDRRRAARDHFVHTVMQGPKVFLVGGAHDFEAVG